MALKTALELILLHENSDHKINQYLTKCRFEQRLFAITPYLVHWLTVTQVSEQN